MLYLGLPLQAQAAPMGLVVKFVVGVHDPAQVDPAHFFCAALVLQVLQQAVDDPAHAALIFQVVHILFKKKKKRCMRQKEKLKKTT